MRRYPIICGLLLAACSPADRAALPVPADLMAEEPGWQGPPPRTEGALIDALAAEIEGREAANARLRAIAQIVAR